MEASSAGPGHQLRCPGRRGSLLRRYVVTRRQSRRFRPASSYLLTFCGCCLKLTELVLDVRLWSSDMTPCLATEQPLMTALCAAAEELDRNSPDDHRVITLLSEHAATVQHVV